MPIPVLFVIAVGVASLAGRKAHDKWADHPPLEGYCSNCGDTTHHDFHESGMGWKKTGSMGILLGAAGIGVSSLLARNVYKCRSCSHLTLSCRFPGCTGMTRTGDYYDAEFCGQCIKDNDNSKLYNAYRDQKELAKVKTIILRMEIELEQLRSKLSELESDRDAHKQLIEQLCNLVERKEAELSMFRRRVA